MHILTMTRFLSLDVISATKISLNTLSFLLHLPQEEAPWIQPSLLQNQLVTDSLLVHPKDLAQLPGENRADSPYNLSRDPYTGECVPQCWPNNRLVDPDAMPNSDGAIGTKHPSQLLESFYCLLLTPLEGLQLKVIIGELRPKIGHLCGAWDVHVIVSAANA